MCGSFVGLSKGTRRGEVDVSNWSVHEVDVTFHGAILNSDNKWVDSRCTKRSWANVFSPDTSKSVLIADLWFGRPGWPKDLPRHLAGKLLRVRTTDNAARPTRLTHTSRHFAPRTLWSLAFALLRNTYRWHPGVIGSYDMRLYRATNGSYKWRSSDWSRLPNPYCHQRRNFDAFSKQFVVLRNSWTRVTSEIQKPWMPSSRSLWHAAIRWVIPVDVLPQKMSSSAAFVDNFSHVLWSVLPWKQWRSLTDSWLEWGKLLTLRKCAWLSTRTVQLAATTLQSRDS